MQSRANRKPPAERRHEVLEKAALLFSKQGFADTTMDDIAAAANVTKRTLYRYVRTKDQLLYDIHEEFAGNHLVPTVDESDDPASRIRQLLRSHVEVVMLQTSKVAVFYEERKHLSSDQRATLRQRRHDYEGLYISAIEDGQAKGVFGAVEPAIAVRIILSALTEVYRWFETVEASPAEVSDTAVELFLHGISPDPVRVPADAVEEGLALKRPVVSSEDPADNIRRVAVERFASVGYKAASIRGMADLADTTKGAVMYHARHKHTLLRDISETALKDALDVATEAQRMAGDPDEQVTRLIAAHLAYLADHASEMAVANENTRYLEARARRVVSRLSDKRFAVLADALTEGAESGAFTSSAGSLVAAHLLGGMLDASYRWYQGDGRFPAGKIAEVYAHLTLNGLRPAPREP